MSQVYKDGPCTEVARLAWHAILLRLFNDKSGKKVTGGQLRPIKSMKRHELYIKEKLPFLHYLYAEFPSTLVTRTCNSLIRTCGRSPVFSAAIISPYGGWNSEMMTGGFSGELAGGFSGGLFFRDLTNKSILYRSTHCQSTRVRTITRGRPFWRVCWSRWVWAASGTSVSPNSEVLRP